MKRDDTIGSLTGEERWSFAHADHWIQRRTVLRILLAMGSLVATCASECAADLQWISGYRYVKTYEEGGPGPLGSLYGVTPYYTEELVASYTGLDNWNWFQLPAHEGQRSGFGLYPRELPSWVIPGFWQDTVLEGSHAFWAYLYPQPGGFFNGNISWERTGSSAGFEMTFRLTEEAQYRCYGGQRVSLSGDDLYLDSMPDSGVLPAGVYTIDGETKSESVFYLDIVPEPGSGTLLMLSSLALARRRRRGSK